MLLSASCELLKTLLFLAINWWRLARREFKRFPAKEPRNVVFMSAITGPSLEPSSRRELHLFYARVTRSLRRVAAALASGCKCALNACPDVCRCGAVTAGCSVTTNCTLQVARRETCRALVCALTRDESWLELGAELDCIDLRRL